MVDRKLASKADAGRQNTDNGSGNDRHADESHPDRLYAMTTAKAVVDLSVSGNGL